MNYFECVDYMGKISKFGTVLGLDTINALLNRLDNPQNNLKCIHVAGTNGKGSVCAYLTRILTVAGYKVGTFNSPAVFSYNERFLLNGKPVSDELVTKYINLVAEEREIMEKQGEKALPTSFEMETAAAFALFRDEKCDVCVIETGLGGRLDATNVIPKENKLFSIITSISFDHTEILGNTLKEIATEKFGIVRNHLITFEQNPDIMEVFKMAPKLTLTKEPSLIIATRTGIAFNYRGHFYRLSMLGEHQMQNAALAIEGAKVLKKLGYSNINKQVVQEALYTTSWPGRLDRRQAKGKTIILDGAHNPQGARTLYNALKLHFPNTKISFVFSAFKDKDIEGVLNSMGNVLKTMYIAKAPTDRGLDVESLKKICLKHSENVITNDSISEALDKALSDDSNVVVVFGSLSILQEAAQKIKEING